MVKVFIHFVARSQCVDNFEILVSVGHARCPPVEGEPEKNERLKDFIRSRLKLVPSTAKPSVNKFFAFRMKLRKVLKSDSRELSVRNDLGTRHWVSTVAD